MSDALIETLSAVIVRILREHHDRMTPTHLIAAARAEVAGVSDDEVRQVLWRLIDARKLDVDRSWRLVPAA